jgi:hypothetical protein
MSSIIPRFRSGKGVNPISSAKGKYGSPMVSINAIMLKMKRYLPGLLLKKFFCVRIIKRIQSSDKTDSINQPV